MHCENLAYNTALLKIMFTYVKLCEMQLIARDASIHADAMSVSPLENGRINGSHRFFRTGQ